MWTSRRKPGHCLRAWALAPLLLCARAHAGFDHELPLDQRGIWARSDQVALEYGVIATEVAGALWFGSDDALGHAFWQAVDASALSGLGAAVMKRVFGRARPDQGADPNAWFRGGCCESFPSGEVTLQASFVTPLIVDFGGSDPWVWALESLPLYDGLARLKSQAHWQSDVLAGWVLGSAVGYWTTTRAVPVSVRFLPRGLTVGFYKRF